MNTGPAIEYDYGNESETLPDWITAPVPEPTNPFPRFPRTKEERALRKVRIESLFALVLDCMANGKSADKMLERLPYNIKLSDVFSTIKHDPALLAAWNDAKDTGAEVHADRMVEIADGEGPEEVARSALRINTRKLVMAYSAPKRYGSEENTSRVSPTINIVIGSVKPAHQIENVVSEQ
jgi:hypothetical protein